MTPEEMAKDFEPVDQVAIADLIRYIRAEEREACARLAESWLDSHNLSLHLEQLPAAIRARGSGERPC